MRNPSLYQGFPTNRQRDPLIPAGSVPQSTPATTGGGTTPFLLPPAIPVRRLFQPPDVTPIRRPRRPRLSRTTRASRGIRTSTTSAQPRARDSGHRRAAAVPGPAAAGHGYHLLCERRRREPVLGSGRDGAAATDHAGGDESVPWGEYCSASASESSGDPNPSPPQFDTKQHPYFRTEMLQKAMNLTTVRTHQYAVWITVGFFEVTRQGDLLMAARTRERRPPPWLSTSSGPRSAPRPARRRGSGASSWSTGSSSPATIPTSSAASARPSSIARPSNNDADSSQCLPEMREREVASGQSPEMRATWRNATSN